MKVRLGLKERICLSDLLASYKANFVTIKAFKKFSDDIQFTEEEVKEHKIDYSMVGDSQRVVWSVEAEKTEIEVDTGEIMTVEVQKLLKDLNKSNSLEVRHISLYEKFVEAPKAV